MINYAELLAFLKYFVYDRDTAKHTTADCDGTLKTTEAFCLAKGINFKKIERELNSKGAYCDCEVFLNAEAKLDKSKELK